MTLSEFKAWFEGFTEGMDATPTEKQWERIKARIGEINGVGQAPVFGQPLSSGSNAIDAGFFDGSVQQQGYMNALNATPPTGNVVAFKSHTAMNALGRAERGTLS